MVELYSLDAFVSAVTKMHEISPDRTRLTVKSKPASPQPNMFLKVTDGPITLTYNVTPAEPDTERLYRFLGALDAAFGGTPEDTIHEDIGFDVEELFVEAEAAQTTRRRRRKKN